MQSLINVICVFNMHQITGTLTHDLEGIVDAVVTSNNFPPYEVIADQFDSSDNKLTHWSNPIL